MDALGCQDAVSLIVKSPVFDKGTKSTTWFSHIELEVPGTDCRNEWCEPVSEEEYGKCS